MRHNDFVGALLNIGIQHDHQGKADERADDLSRDEAEQ
jgi:hypothetical protein